MGRKQKKQTKQVEVRGRSFPRELLETALYGLALLVFCRGFVWANFNIPTKSMENSLLVGDHLIANNFIFRSQGGLDSVLLPSRPVARGDIITLKSVSDGKTPLVKRCIGLPGDRFFILNDQVYLDGEPLVEPYVYYKNPFEVSSGDRDPVIGFRPKGYFETKPGLAHAQYRVHSGSLSMPELRAMTRRSLNRFRPLDPGVYEQVMERLDRGDPEAIPPGFYLAMGDNRNLSEDSRRFGLVPQEFILGKAHLVWWSYGEDENSHELKNMDLVWSYLRVPLTFWTRTHWRESMRFIR